MFAKIYRLIWRLLHLFASMYSALRLLAYEVQAAMPWSYDFWHRGTLITRRDRAFIEHCKTQLQKVPRHLNIILGTGDSYRSDADVVSRISTYALLFGIEYISFYDPAGGIEVDTLGIPELKGIKKKIIGTRHLLWEWSSTATNICPQEKMNGGDWPMRLEIAKILPCDNQPLIARVCRDLFEKRRSVELQSLLKDRNEFTKYIDAEIQQHSERTLPDPDLSIVFEDQICTYGMLPWQTRFTEFYNFERGQRVNPKTFAKILYRYSRCEQRWGK